MDPLQVEPFSVIGTRPRLPSPRDWLCLFLLWHVGAINKAHDGYMSYKGDERRGRRRRQRAVLAVLSLTRLVRVPQLREGTFYLTPLT